MIFLIHMIHKPNVGVSGLADWMRSSYKTPTLIISKFRSHILKEDIHRKLDFSVILLIQTTSAGMPTNIRLTNQRLNLVSKFVFCLYMSVNKATLLVC